MYKSVSDLNSYVNIRNHLAWPKQEVAAHPCNSASAGAGSQALRTREVSACDVVIPEKSKPKIESMNFLKLSVLAASAAFVIGSGAKVHATIIVPLTAGTYTFEATSGGTFANGSTVTFTLVSNTLTLTAWDLIDTTNADFPLTQNNSEFSTSVKLDNLYYSEGVLSVANDQWGYNIVSDNYASKPADYDEIGNDGTQSPPGNAYLGSDPTGNWVADPVPDSSGTFGLLAGALAALGICASGARRRNALGA
jgi:hypothetical protein